MTVAPLEPLTPPSLEDFGLSEYALKLCASVNNPAASNPKVDNYEYDTPILLSHDLTAPLPSCLFPLQLLPSLCQRLDCVKLKSCRFLGR